MLGGHRHVLLCRRRASCFGDGRLAPQLAAVHPQGQGARDAVHGPNGFLYLATELGISTFDGRRFVPMASTKGEEFFALLFDAQGTLWAGGQGKISMLDLGGSKPRRTEILLPTKGCTTERMRGSVSKEPVKWIARSWVATDRQLFSIDGDGVGLPTQACAVSLPVELGMVRGLARFDTGLLVWGKGGLWFSAAKPAMGEADVQKIHWVPWVIGRSILSVAVAEDGPDRGIVWVSTENPNSLLQVEIGRFDGKARQRRKTTTVHPSPSNEPQRHLLVDDQGELWGATGTYLHRFHAGKLAHRLSLGLQSIDTTVRGLRAGRDGALWLLYPESGLVQVDRTPIVGRVDSGFPSPGRFAWSVAGGGPVDGSQTVWSSLGVGLVGVGRGQAVERVPGGSAGLPFDLRAIAYETGGPLWLGTLRHGLMTLRFVGQRPKATPFELREGGDVFRGVEPEPYRRRM